MKTLRKVMLTVMMVMVAAVGFANGNKPEVNVKALGAKVVSVQAQGLGNSETKVQIKNENGVILHQLVADNSDKYVKRLDLTALPEGNYTLELENETSFTATPIKLEAEVAKVMSQDQIMIIKPVVRQNGNMLDLIMTGDTATSVDVTIYDGNLKPVFKETVDGSTELRRYDLSRLGNGGYRIKLNARGKEFIQFVALR